MASAKKSFFSKKPNFFSKPNHISPEPIFEFDESDWNPTQIQSTQSMKKSCSKPKKRTDKSENDHQVGLSSTSLPVNIPDWSKILKQEYKEKTFSTSYLDEEEDCEEEENRVPPHEFLARQFARSGVSSFSVHEGVGRTLKGRDLSRVRNAIWAKTGFED